MIIITAIMANNKCIKSRSKYSFVNFMNGIITQLHNAELLSELI